MKTNNNFIPCPRGGRCWNPLCVFGCVNSRKRIFKRAFLLLISLLLTSFSSAQVGCHRSMIDNKLNEIKFSSAEYINTQDYIFLKTLDQSIFIFNLQGDICIQMTAFIGNCSTDFITITQLLKECGTTWACSVKRTLVPDVAIYRIRAAIN